MNKEVLLATSAWTPTQSTTESVGLALEIERVRLTRDVIVELEQIIRGLPDLYQEPQNLAFKERIEYLFPRLIELSQDFEIYDPVFRSRIRENIINIQSELNKAVQYRKYVQSQISDWLRPERVPLN